MTMNGRGPNLPTPEQIERMMNPTGGTQTPTPWRAQDDGPGRHFLTNSFGNRIALFDRKEDRDFAMFWANTHAGVISLLRGFKCGFEFVAMGEPEGSGTRHYAKTQAEIAAIWEEFFTTLGKSAIRAAELQREIGDQEQR
jgi:hypothetical protein